MKALNEYGKNDLEYLSHGQEGSAMSGDLIGQVVGGVYSTATLTLNDGDFGRLQMSSDGALKVDLASSEAINVTVGSIVMTKGTIATGTINTGTIDLLKAGTITKLEGGTIVMTQPITTATVANTIAVEGSTVTSANTLVGMMKGVTIVTGSLEGTGTATVELKDETAGTIFTQAITEAASPVYYGSVVPLNTGMNWVVTTDGTQSAAATVNLAVHYQK